MPPGRGMPGQVIHRPIKPFFQPPKKKIVTFGFGRWGDAHPQKPKAQSPILDAGSVFGPQIDGADFTL